MKKLSRYFAAALLVSAGSLPMTTFAQGSLTPPGAPAPTMKTLDQIEARTPISSLPYTIKTPGSYYVTTNLTGLTGNSGIVISSGNVTVDLGGFTLQGVAGTTVGVYVAGGYTNLVVRNGNITGWGGCGVDAFSAGYPRNMSFQRLNISANGDTGLYLEAGSSVSDCLVTGNVGDGISIAGGEVIRCLCLSNTGRGIIAQNCTVQDCRSEKNQTYGVYLNRCAFLNCAVETNSTYGVFIDGVGSIVRGCRIVSNTGAGVYCNAGDGGNLIADCVVAQNAEAGIFLSNNGNSVTGNNLVLNAGGGIVFSGSNNRIENNQVHTSGTVWGIGVNGPSFTNNVVIKNTVFGGTYNYFFQGNNDFGPIGTAATATSPWANISH